MGSASRFVGRVGLTAGGAAIALALAAGSGHAAAHYSSVMVSEHSIAVQPTADDRGGLRGASDDVTGVDNSATSSEPELGDDRVAGESGSREPEPSDDRNQAAASQAVQGNGTGDDGATHESGTVEAQLGDDHGKDASK